MPGLKRAPALFIYFAIERRKNDRTHRRPCNCTQQFRGCGNAAGCSCGDNRRRRRFLPVLARNGEQQAIAAISAIYGTFCLQNERPMFTQEQEKIADFRPVAGERFRYKLAEFFEVRLLRFGFVEKPRERQSHGGGAHQAWQCTVLLLRPSADQGGEKKAPANRIDRRRQIDGVGVGIEKKLLVLVVPERTYLRQKCCAVQEPRKP